MGDIITLAIRAFVGGAFVMGFAVLGEVLVPKRFAGIMSAAPSVALANLLLVVLTEGCCYAFHESQGMVIGASAFLVAAFVGRWLVSRFGALRGSLALCLVWLLVAIVGYVALLS